MVCVCVRVGGWVCRGRKDEEAAASSIERRNPLREAFNPLLRDAVRESFSSFSP